MTPPPAAAAAGDEEGQDARPARPSLPESYRTVPVPLSSAVWWRKLGAFAGPGYLVAVGYMDPGNWATGIAGGSAFGYSLLSVILLSNLMAMVLQSLAAKLGIVTGMDLAQACRAHYSRPVRWFLWVMCELAIIATDLAEVIGTAIALQLLFGIPLVWGVCLTALDVFLILALQRYGFRKLEAFIIALVVVIGVCFGIELFLAQPSLAGIGAGLVPDAEILSNPTMLFIAIGIIGATVMPHNLYLHSSIVQTRNFARNHAGKREAVRYATIDSTIALALALFINGAILVLARRPSTRRGARRSPNPERINYSRRCSALASPAPCSPLPCSRPGRIPPSLRRSPADRDGRLSRNPSARLAAAHGDAPSRDRARR
jgi:manganese transport protein